MRILVLGGAGYIGSHTALELVKAGHKVIVADNLVTGFRSAVPKAAKFYEGDIRNAEFLDKLFTSGQIDAVIHFAAFSLVGESDIFNLGNGVGYSVREVIETARKVTGHSIPAVEIERRAGDPARLVASSKKSA